MSNLALELIGRAEGLSSEQIAKLEADAPTFAALVKLSVEARPLIEQAQTLYDKAKPLIAQAMAEWATVAPDVLAVLALVGAPSAPTDSGPGAQTGGGIGS